MLRHLLILTVFIACGSSLSDYERAVWKDPQNISGISRDDLAQGLVRLGKIFANRKSAQNVARGHLRKRRQTNNLNGLEPPVSGQRGDPGLKGNRGAPGLKGRDGFPGSVGDTGPEGPPGPSNSLVPNSNPQGIPGLPGVPGPKGIIGDIGETGDTGLTGDSFTESEIREICATIFQGLIDSATINGIPGPPGKVGLTGPPGFNGYPGLKGETGYAGPKGVAGKRGICPDCYLQKHNRMFSGS